MQKIAKKIAIFNSKDTILVLIELSGVGETPSDIVTLMNIEAGGRTMIMLVGNCFGTEDAIAHLDHIQINLQNTFLAPK